MPFGFDWVDAFSAQPFGGNGCVVVHDAADLPDESCTALVRETSLSECTFLGPSDRADLRVRYFLATREIPFAGHPTIATVASLIDRGLAGNGIVTLETGAGLIEVEISEADTSAPLITMTQPRPDYGDEVTPELVAGTVRLTPGAIVGSPRIVSTGLPFCVTVLRDKDALAAAELDPAGLQAFRDAVEGPDTEVMEPFLVTLGGASAGGDTFSRLLMAPPLPAEDPFTGSATGAMAAYLWASGLIERPDFIAEQGHWLGRPGQARVEVLGPPHAIEGVRVGGQGYVLMRGFLNLA